MLNRREIETPPPLVDRALRHADASHSNRMREQMHTASMTFALIGKTLQTLQKIYGLVLSVEMTLDSLAQANKPADKTALLELYHKIRDEIDLSALGATVGDHNLINGRNTDISLHSEWDRRADYGLSQIDLTVGRRGLKIPQIDKKDLSLDTIEKALAHTRRAQQHVVWAESVFVSEAAVMGKRFKSVLKDI